MKREKFSTATVTRESVLDAIEQFDRIGRSAFLEKFARGRSAQRGNKGRQMGPYFVEHDWKQYDATALVRAARFLADPKRQRGLSRQEVEGPTPWLGWWHSGRSPRLGPDHWKSRIETLEALGFKVVR